LFKANTKQKGRVGEHFVAYLLEAAGREAVRVDGTGCDLHVTAKSGRVIRVEVKTCGKAQHGTTLRFHIGRSNAEVFAFVSLVNDQPLVRMFERHRVPKWSMHINQFTEETQQADLEWFLSLT